MFFACSLLVFAFSSAFPDSGMPPRSTTARESNRRSKGLKQRGRNPPQLLLAHEQRVYCGGVSFDTIKALTPDELISGRSHSLLYLL